MSDFFEALRGLGERHAPENVQTPEAALAFMREAYTAYEHWRKSGHTPDFSPGDFVTPKKGFGYGACMGKPCVVLEIFHGAGGAAANIVGRFPDMRIGTVGADGELHTAFAESWEWEKYVGQDQPEAGKGKGN